MSKSFREITGSCPAYCPCRVLDDQGETPRNPEICPYEADPELLGATPEARQRTADFLASL